MSFDAKHLTLGEAFMEDYEPRSRADEKIATSRIAQAIQDAIEAELDDLLEEGLITEPEK